MNAVQICVVTEDNVKWEIVSDEGDGWMLVRDGDVQDCGSLSEMLQGLQVQIAVTENLLWKKLGNIGGYTFWKRSTETYFSDHRTVYQVTATANPPENSAFYMSLEYLLTAKNIPLHRMSELNLG